MEPKKPPAKAGKKPSRKPSPEPAPPAPPRAGGKPKNQPFEQGVENELLTVEQVAKIVKVCKKSVFEMAKTGKLPSPVKITPRCLRWRRTELGEWIKALRGEQP